MGTQPPEFLTLGDRYAAYKPVFEKTLNATIDHIDDVIRYCRQNLVKRLLIDITGVTGFPPPTTIERYMFATKWAETAGGKMTISMIAPPEMIDRDKIGVTMASNRGLPSNVFTDETEAVEWLLGN